MAKNNPIHDAVLKAMELEATPLPDSPSADPQVTEQQATEPVGAPAEAPAEPPAPAAAVSPDPATAGETPSDAPTQEKRRGPRWKQRYRDLQSFADKRLSEMQQHIAALEQKLQQTQAPPEEPVDLSDPRQAEEYQRRQVRKTLEEDYGLDPVSVAALKLPAEVTKYRQANPGMERYDELVVPVAGKLAGKEPITAKHLSQALEMSTVIVDALNSMIAREAAAKQKPVQPEATAPKGQPVAASKQPITPEQRAKLQQQTTQLATNRGVALDGLPERKARSFQEKVRMALDEAMGTQG